MSLDQHRSVLARTGRVEITVNGISVHGFEGVNCSCRDVAVLAALWAIGELQREVLRAVEDAGSANIGVGS